MAITLSHPAPAENLLNRSSARAEYLQALRVREEGLSRLLMAFITTGLIFMVFPGTFLGVWNLLQISGGESVGSISPAWIQAHGHAQVFGWVGSFILGIGYYSIPKLRGTANARFRAAWICWALWTTGAGLRWAANIYRWEWRLILPISALLEVAAFLIFFRTVSQHRPEDSGKKQLDSWIWVVISASVGLLSLLVVNLAGCFYVAFREATPAFPHVFDQRYLALMAWGFLVPFVWGFSAKWMGVFLGLKPLRPKLLAVTIAINLTGLAFLLAGITAIGVWLVLVGTIVSIGALRMFEPSVNEPKTRGVHSSFPLFVRIAYAWLMVAAVLGVAACYWDTSGGIWGASRHALTVGFISVMILCVGQRILPAFAGMRTLWSTKLMFLALLLLCIGCTLRVSMEVLAYQGYANWAWEVLPASALTELTALTLFAINMMGTLILQPTHARNEPMVATIAGKGL
jgi:uncharacterized protein involved in response to NO